MDDIQHPHCTRCPFAGGCTDNCPFLKASEDAYAGIMGNRRDERSDMALEMLADLIQDQNISDAHFRAIAIGALHAVYGASERV